MKPIEQKMFMQYKSLSDLKANDDNTMVGWIVTQTDAENNTYKKSLHLYDDKEIREFNKPVDSFIFDGEYILSKKASKFETKFTRFSIDGEIVKEFTLPLMVLGIRRLQKSHTYLLIAKVDITCDNYYMLDEDKQTEFRNKAEEESGFHILDEYPYYFNAVGYVNNTRKSLFIYNEQTGEIKRITPATMDVDQLDVNRNEILYAGKDYFAEDKEFTAQVYVYEIENDETQTLYSKNDLRVTHIFYKDGIRHVGGTKGLRHGYTEHPIFYKISGPDTLVEVADLELGIGNTIGSDTRHGSLSNYVNYKGKPYFIATQNTTAIAYTFEGNSLIPVIKIDGSTDTLAFLNGKMITIGMYNMRLQEIYSVSNNVPSRISNFNEWVQQYYFVSKPIANTISQQDYDVEGFILPPINYDANKTYPLVLSIHGGPKAAYGPVFSHEMQRWSAMGCFVAYCNPKGSDGKGNFFTNIRGGVYGSVPFDDIMKFTDSVLDKYPQIDKNRMTVTGGSYGGYMTNYFITHTNRFACAISYCSISNWISMALSSDCGIDFPIKMKLDMNNYFDDLWELSPLKYVNNVTTPTLFVHGVQDYRCPIAEGLQMFTAMKLLGVDSRMLALEGENHELSRHGKPTSKLKRFEETENWITKYCF
ncbi:hypothetical protein AN639_04575 [Candidatus Epulonipiscium fishelsonii]|uniref:Uncharacterized protein n=1 Tax=Candidatus Epulonipiscium fishelsonii TaxID=77094 RepID=A0ACC8XFD9_9FIRM|nr:hypothetical protein AN639_04575 [Epulopiscium sp. SCG-B05WGA-EpuloA1]ONI41934.1 hypothetical protein AN396_02740 [Epulopiscium sp. SCG-B11WGA-EpuloA1]